jgi:hypothetical protein
MARKIHPLTIDGEFLDDSKMSETRAKYESVLLEQARENGYVPVLDLDTSWSPTYYSDEDRWFFSLTLYVIYVGKKKSYEYEGFTNNCLIPIQSSKHGGS